MRRGAFALALLLQSRAGAAQEPAQVLVPRIVAEYPHDPAAFTQGLVFHDGWFYESTGLRGRSTVRRVEPSTGLVAAATALPSTDFGEGLALVGERLIQLTWQEQVARVYDRATLTEASQFRYEGEGWGLCFDGERLVMSDGSTQLFFRDPTSFDVVGEVTVTRDGTPVDQLNELECVRDHVYANVWHSDEILRIDPDTGVVDARIEASGLLTSAEAAEADVLNGIAYDSGSGHFFLTGKLWPKLFEVSFEARDAGDPAGPTTLAPTEPEHPAPPPVPTAVAERPDAAAPPRAAHGSGCMSAKPPGPGRAHALGWLALSILVAARRSWTRAR